MRTATGVNDGRKSGKDGYGVVYEYENKR